MSAKDDALVAMNAALALMDAALALKLRASMLVSSLWWSWAPSKKKTQVPMREPMS